MLHHSEKVHAKPNRRSTTLFKMIRPLKEALEQPEIKMRKGFQDMARTGLGSLLHQATYRWLWSFIPSLFFAIFVAREYIYSRELIGQIESLDVEHMNSIIPPVASVEVKAKTNLGRPVSPVWRSKEGDDPESGYLLFGDAKKNMIFRLDRLSHSVFARKPGR